MWKGAGVRCQAARPRTCRSFAAGPWVNRSNLPSQLCSIVTVKPLRWVPTHRNTEPTLVGGVGLPALHADGHRSTQDRRGSPLTPRLKQDHRLRTGRPLTRPSRLSLPLLR